MMAKAASSPTRLMWFWLSPLAVEMAPCGLGIERSRRISRNAPAKKAMVA